MREPPAGGRRGAMYGLHGMNKTLSTGGKQRADILITTSRESRSLLRRSSGVGLSDRFARPTETDSAKTYAPYVETGDR